MNRIQHNREVDESSNQDSRQPTDSGLKSAEKETRRLARGHYENFLVASVLLPRRLRQPFYNVYAFCRQADDFADESSSPDVALRELATFQEQLDAAFAGRPNSPLFLALHHTIQQFDLPKQPFDDLLDAFRQDQHKTRYTSSGELLDYCCRSANPVGRIVLRLGACFDETNAALSDHICSGLQLANFWQDIARDYAIGRIYIPLDEMAEAGVTEEMIGAPATSAELRALVARLCDWAEEFFEAGLPLADRVPRWLASDIKLFAHGGLETLSAIRRVDFDVLRARPTVSKWRQSGLVLRALLGRL